MYGLDEGLVVVNFNNVDRFFLDEFVMLKNVKIFVRVCYVEYVPKKLSCDTSHHRRRGSTFQFIGTSSARRTDVKLPVVLQCFYFLFNTFHEVLSNLG